MGKQFSGLRMSLMATSMSMLFLNYGCGGATDMTAAVVEAAAGSTSSARAASLVLDETSKKKRSQITQSAASITVPTQLASVTTSPSTAASVTTDPSSTATAATSVAPLINAINSSPGTLASSTDQPLTASLPLVQAQDLVYQGAFRLPDIYTGNVCDGMTFSGGALAFDVAGDSGAGSLYLTGHGNCGALVAEVSIPSPVNSNELAQLPRSRMLQSKQNSLYNALEGKLETSGITGGATTTVNGLLIYGDKLAISAGNHYAYSQPVSHWTRPKDLSILGQVSDPITVVGDKGYNAARFTAGYMCHVPPEHQAALGGPAVTGWTADSIVTATSDGPAAFAFDPKLIGAGSNVPAKTLLFYRNGELEPSVGGKTQQVWNWAAVTRGCAMPNGTRSLLYLGSHGIGEFQYGVGGVNGHTNTTPQVPIYDPSDESTGEHAWPYRYQVWAYDINDLAKVNAGTLTPGQVKPYAVWRVTLPFENPDGRHSVGGVAYNPKTRQLFMIQGSAGPWGESVVQVFQVRNASSTSN